MPGADVAQRPTEAASDAAEGGVSGAASGPASPRPVAVVGTSRLLICGHHYQNDERTRSLTGGGAANEAERPKRKWRVGRDRRGGVCAAQQAFSASAPSGGICEARACNAVERTCEQLPQRPRREAEGVKRSVRPCVHKRGAEWLRRYMAGKIPHVS